MSRTKNYIDCQKDGLYPYIWSAEQLAEMRHRHEINAQWQQEEERKQQAVSSAQNK